MATQQQRQAAISRVLGLASQLRKQALDELANEPVYDHTTYDKIPLPPAKDDAYLEGAPLTTKSKSGRKLRVVCAGSGATGITVVREYYRNPDVMESCEVALYEALATHGGTWMTHRYPGCACDVPSHLYSFSFAPNPNWTKVYSSSPEIYAYFDRVARQVGVPDRTRYNCRITKAEWDPEYAVWRLEYQRERQIEDGSEWGRKEVLSRGTDWCDVLINGTGALSKPRDPDIPGLNTFAGRKLHTGHWDHKFDWKGKTILQIGNGASGIQAFSELQPTAKQITLFQRTPSWITSYRLKGAYSQEDKEHFARDEAGWRKMRAEMWDDWEKGWDMFVPSSLNQQKMMGAAVRNLEKEIKDPELRKKLQPSYAVGCRRLTPSPTFLHCIQQPNVTLSLDTIVRIVPEGVVTQSKDGKETVHKGEVLVLATGYDTRWVPSFELKGLNGHVIQRDWEDYAVSYHSLMVAHYPNMFFSLGPNAPLGSNSALPILERTVKYIYRNVLAMRAYSIRSVVPKEEVQNEWFEWAQQWLSTTVWASRGCGGWYKKPKRKGLSHEVADGTGIIQAIYPGTTNSFLRFIADVHWDHMNVEFEPGKERPLNTLQGAKQDFERDGGLALIPVSWDWSDWDAQLTLPKA